MKVYNSDRSDEMQKKSLIDGRYTLPSLIDMDKLEYFFDLFTVSTGFTASLILHPEHNILIKSGCRKLCQDLKCIDPENARECIAEDLLMDSEIREMNEITMRMSGIGLADGALPVIVRGVYCANIISGHVFLEKPDPDVLFRAMESGELKDYLQMVGGIEHIPVVDEDVLKASLLMLRDMTVLLAEQRLNRLYEEEAMKSIRESEELFRIIANSIPGVVYRFYVRPGGEMGFYFINGRSEEILGIEGNPEGFFHRIYQQIAPEDREGFISSINDAVLGFKRWEHEAKIFTPSGEERYIRGISQPERSGDEIIFNGVLLDVTDRKRTEDALRLSEERYRMLAEFTGELIYDRDLCGGKIHWAGHAEGMSGFSADELERTGIEGWRKRLHPDDNERVSAAENMAMEGHSMFSAEYRLMKPDGKYMYIEESGGFLYDESGKPVRMLGVMKDITERVCASEERIQLERKLLYAQKMESLGAMAGGIAHDFNNFLMGIMGSIELALLQVKPGTDIYKNLKRAINVSYRAADITAQMLAYSGRTHFTMSPVQPAPFIAGISDMLRSCLRENISFRSDVPGNIPEIMVDAGQFRQVLINLVTNSSEAIGNREGEIVISAGEEFFSDEYLETNIAGQRLKQGRYVYIDISDNGCGMDDDIKGRLFDPFFSTKQTGRGLGLPAVQGIMKGHGGAVVIESDRNYGAKVRIIFPVLEKRDTAFQSTASVAAGCDRGDIVLVVDDEDEVRNLCMEFVGIAGFKALGAEDGEKGLEIFRKESENLGCVLLDLSMPKIDGVTAFNEMKKINPDVPVILCSGYSEEDATRSFSGERLAGFLQKPYRLDLLKSKLESVIKNRVTQ